MSEDEYHSTMNGPVRATYMGGYLNPLADSAFLPVGSQAWQGAQARESEQVAFQESMNPSPPSGVGSGFAGASSGGPLWFSQTIGGALAAFVVSLFLTVLFKSVVAYIWDHLGSMGWLLLCSAAVVVFALSSFMYGALLISLVINKK